jgi:hypothetical protein
LWVTEIRDRCVDAGVPFFFKQWGGRTPKEGGRELEGRTWSQMPARAAAVSDSRAHDSVPQPPTWLVNRQPTAG